MSDPAKYRAKEEVQKMRSESDPIERIKNILLDDKHMDEAAVKEIDKEIKARVADAVTYAQECPEPDLSELYTDVTV